jgi:hypothetical protein
MIHPRHSIENSVARAGALSVSICKQILNSLIDATNRSVTRGRFAELSLRALDDIGLTIAERDDLLLR